jgi:uncharacterized protein YciI
VLFVIRGVDRPDHGSVRAAVRERHLAYVRSFGDRIVIGGPLLDESGEAMAGSLLVVDFPDREGVQAFLDGDPYGEAGLFASVTVDRWRQTVGAPLVDPA